MSEQATFKLSRALLLAPEPQPWRRDTPPLEQVNPIPSMIFEDESRFLHWIARHCVSGEGHVVDLGPLAGGSTHALCSGLALNPSAARRAKVHSYDLWRFMPGWDAFFPGRSLEPGADLRSYFKDNLRAFGDRVITHAGDLRKKRWSGEPIDILFIDAAKTPSLWLHILRTFFPCLVPGRSLIVHQDWVSGECPWIHLTMARLAEYVVPVDSPDAGTVAFRLEKAVPPELLQVDDIRALPGATMRACFAQAESWMRGWYALEIRLAEAHLHVLRGDRQQAERVLAGVLEHPDCNAVVRGDAELVRVAFHKPLEEPSRLRRVLRRPAPAVSRTIARLRAFYHLARDGFRVRHLDDEFVRWLCYVNAGMLRPGNAWCMDYAIRRLAPEQAVVEIGSFAGLSANVICHLLRKYGRANRLYSCDNWDVTGRRETRRIAGSALTFPEYAEYVKQAFLRNVEFFSPGNRPHTVEAAAADFFGKWEREERVVDVFGREARLGGPIGFAYVDGLHSYDAVRRDFENVDRHMPPGGFILFDDSADSSPFGLNRLMREIRGGGRYGLVAQAPNYFFRKR